MTVPGGSPLNYRPNSQGPNKRVSVNRAPTTNDYRSFNEGDEWLDTSSNDWYKLTDITGTSALWVFIGGTGTTAEKFIPDSGTSPVKPNASNEITITGSNGITVVGGTNSLTIDSENGQVATDFLVSSGTSPVVPDSSGEITLNDGDGIAWTGGTNALTANMSSPYSGRFVFGGSVVGTENFLLNGATQVISADGRVYICSAMNGQQGRLAIRASGTNREHLMLIDYSWEQFDTAACLNVAVNRAYTNQQVLTNVQMWSDGAATGSNTRWISVDVGNRNGADVTLFASFIGSNFSANVDTDFFPSAPGTPTSVPLYGFTTGATGAEKVLTFTNSSSATEFSVTSGNSANENRIVVENTEGSAGADAALVAQVSAGSSGDSLTKWGIDSGVYWSAGLDNSDSDAWVLSQNDSLGTNNYLIVDTNGRVNIPTGLDVIDRSLAAPTDVMVVATRSGASVGIAVANLSNTASSTAFQKLTIGGSSAASAYTVYEISGRTSFSAGVLGSDSTFRIANNSTGVGTSDFLISTTDGETTYPLQPAFLAYLGTTTNNVTGNGTQYTINYSTEVFDQNADYDNTTYTFTAPVTGRYSFSCFVYVINGGTATSANFRLVTSNRNYNTYYLPSGVSISGGNEDFATSMTTMADMDAGDTAYVTITYTGIGADTADIAGTNAAGRGTYFSGSLVC